MKEHLIELESEFWRYADRHRYEGFVRRRRKGQPGDLYIMLRITEPPSQRLAILIGAAIHNMRSALDTLAVAMAPRGGEDKRTFYHLSHRFARRDGVTPSTYRRAADRAPSVLDEHGIMRSAHAVWE